MKVEHATNNGWSPLRAGTRAARRFSRRPRATQLRTVALVALVGIGTAVYVAEAPASPGPGTTAAGATTGGSGSSSAVEHASTSTRGISGNTINVAFPVVSLNSLAGKEGFAQDVEFGEQVKAIHFFVNEINKQGGINGRKINPLIANFDPTDEASMRALCKDWTEGSPAAFAVIDGVGTWTGDNQLCITQEGHTPLISQWTTVSNWTQEGAPYLWWTGPDDAAIIQATVNWGLQSGLLGEGRKVGVIAGDRASDQDALNQYLIPDLQRAGVNATVETIAADPSETATTNTEAPLVVQKLKAAGVNSLIPLIPFNVFFPVLQAQTQQQYDPRLLLSDYEESITSALGLIPIPYEQALDGQEGVTTQTLGGFDDARPESQGGYDPGVRSCYEDWHKAYPNPVGTSQSAYIEEQGPIQAWCTSIRLFATAARNAGSDLNRRTFVEAMSKIQNFPGGFTPVLSYGPNKYYGPTQYQVVELHNNVPPSSACKLKTNGQPQGTCWVVVHSWQPLPLVLPNS
ncbi:MAG: ABC transporter substrate-binding protein [Acidimicrobiales bacterium]